MSDPNREFCSDIPQRITAINETIVRLTETIRVMGEPKGWCLARCASDLSEQIKQLAATVEKLASQKGAT